MHARSRRSSTPTVAKRNPPGKKSTEDGVESPLSQVTLHLPAEERRQLAKALRKRCPRKSLAEWRPTKRRPNPVDILIRSSKGRVESLVPIRYGRMLASPFTFYRGAAAVMTSDLSMTAVTGIHLQICGDCHLCNFGGFATPERKLVFDINDFDETSIGPWEWDAKRLCASLVVASRSNGFSETDAYDIAWSAAKSYQENMARFAEMPLLDAWYDQIDLQGIIDNIKDDELKALAQKRLRKATENTAHTKEFVKLAVQGGSPPSIQDDPPLIYHDRAVAQSIGRDELKRIFDDYRHTLSPERRVLLDRFEPQDFAQKVVGVGSVGTYCGIILLTSGQGDPLFLQYKEARESVIDPFIGKNIYAHQGQRVVAGQRLMQSASDIFLGWTEGPTRQFYIRQLRDAKISPEIALMRVENLINYGKLCSQALARSHARSGDAVYLSAYLGQGDAFADAMTAFAVAYADQNERDYKTFVDAVRAGRIEAHTMA
jgi:uncharacterized protein (DUF2252 family)